MAQHITNDKVMARWHKCYYTTHQKTICWSHSAAPGNQTS